MGWKDTWRETVESFLREVREEGGDPVRGDDPVVEAIAGARREVAGVERELAEASARLDAETESAAACERRRAQAERIGDDATARLAARFGRRHEARAEVFRRKRAVLEEELVLARAAVNDLLDYARADAGPSEAPEAQAS